MANKCSLCGAAHATQNPVNGCGYGFVCEFCAESARVGRDNTTRQAKAKQRTLLLKAEALRTVAAGGVVDQDTEYALAFWHDDTKGHISNATPSGGDGPPRLIDTMASPTATALDAEAERLSLVSSIGTDVVAMAEDASDTIQASNSLERMLSHQLAALHKAGFEYMSRAALVQDPNQSARLMNLAIRSMSVYQDGLMTLKRLRSTGEQKILIERVNVEAGGQAIVGNVSRG